MVSIFVVIMRYIHGLSTLVFVTGVVLIGVGAAYASSPFLIGGVIAVVVGTLIGFFSTMG